MYIRITSKLSKVERQRISRREYDGSYNDTAKAYTHAGRNLWLALGDDPHVIARRMMVYAGRTFSYEIVNAD